MLNNLTNNNIYIQRKREKNNISSKIYINIIYSIVNEGIYRKKREKSSSIYIHIKREREKI